MILPSKCVDILLLNETKLISATHPQSFGSNLNYHMLRRDKTNKSGGIIVYIRKGLRLIVQDCGQSNNFPLEYIYVKIASITLTFNIIACYKPPSYSEQVFLDGLEELIFSINSDEPLFLIGDMNMDLLTSKGSALASFIANNSLKNFTTDATRIATRHMQQQNRLVESRTLIDVVLHNGSLVNASQVFACPFSDHSFVAVRVATPAPLIKPQTVLGANSTTSS